MVSKKLMQVNWEKISVYIAITVGFLTVISYLFGLKDEICDLRERIAVLEVEVDKLEK